MEAQRAESMPGMVGRSRALQEVCALIRKVAPTNLSVLILGENGTGKELIAQAIHWEGKRANGPFVPVNCAGLPDTLVESELFGHEKGAFTGAIARRKGKFEHADGGDIFLDEIGDMPIIAQAKTLRVLQERTVERIGANESKKIDVRVISATNKDLERAVEERTFRADLFYRLKGVVIKAPPLRERKEDIPLLARSFMDVFARETEQDVRIISRPAMEALMDYAFPGNVRELKNIIERAVALSEGPEITVRDLCELTSTAAASDDYWDCCGVCSSELLSALKSIPASERHSQRFWHLTLKCTNIETIHRFLIATNGEQFSRYEFSNYLSMFSKNARNKYGTVGDYLSILRNNGIVVRNSGKANQARFRLHGDFVKNAEGL